MGSNDKGKTQFHPIFKPPHYPVQAIVLNPMSDWCLTLGRWYSYGYISGAIEAFQLPLSMEPDIAWYLFIMWFIL